MTLPTANAVPSNAPQDLLFNAEKIDEAVNSSALQYADRRGVMRMTLAGAMAAVAAINPRGAWATATLYSPRDVVLSGGTWYIALDTHTSGATFAGDQAAHWRVHQGVISADLASQANTALGSGMSGHNQTLGYDTGTVGGWINGQMVNAQAHPFNAVADGVTDCRQAVIDLLTHCNSTGKIPYFPPGTYYLSDSIKPTNGSRLMLVGAHRDLVTIKCANGKIPFHCDQTIGVDNRLTGAHIEGITFDGGHTRNPANYPYNADTGNSILQALNLRFAKGSGDVSNCVITRCRFKNINGLPIWVADADGSVEVSFNEFIRTKDPGILYCNNVTVVGNVSRFSADNGLSISRSNQNIYVAFNHITDCASSGIFVGGVNATGAGANLTLTGGSYAMGATLTLSATAGTFGSEDKGINFTLRNGTDRAIVRLVSIASNVSATGVALRAVPASLQAAATSDWSRGPISGAQAGGIFCNVIEGASNYGIHLSAGCKDLRVSGNVIRRTGITADSEVFTNGTMLQGSTSLVLDDASAFAANDWLVVLPDYTSEDYFIAKANSIVGNTVTASAAPPQTLVAERVHRAYRRTGAYGILAIGQYESATILEFAEGLEIFDNTIVDSVTGGIRAGSTSGAIRKSSIYKNRVTLRQTAHVEAAVYGVLIGDVGTDMRTVLVEVHENTIRLNNASGSRGITYKPIDNNAASYIDIGDNTIQECVTTVEVIEQTGSTNITKDYMPTSRLGSLNTSDMVNTDVIALSYWSVATVAAGVMTVTKSLNSYTPGSPTTITDVAVSGINHVTPLIIIRNADATNSITFTHNMAKIRTKGAANVTVPPGGSITFVPITSAIVQQVA
jgi:hypothetical protein